MIPGTASCRGGSVELGAGKKKRKTDSGAGTVGCWDIHKRDRHA